MEYNHLQSVPLATLRNRLMLLHHFSELVCSSLALFDLQPRVKEHVGQEPVVALDALRGVLIPSGKVRIGAIDINNLSCRFVYICQFCLIIAVLIRGLNMFSLFTNGTCFTMKVFASCGALCEHGCNYLKESKPDECPAFVSEELRKWN